MPASDEAVRRYRATLEMFRARTAAGLVLVWDALESLDDEEQFLVGVAPVLTAASRATVSTAAAFTFLALGERPRAVIPSDVVINLDRRGPLLAAWHAFSEGRPYEEAVEVGRSRTQALAFDHVQSTSRRTGDVAAATTGRTVRWRRVPGSKACDWCRTVSGQLYRTAESADFGHDRDDCVVVPA